MYPEYMQESLRKVEETRAKRLQIAREKGKEDIYPAMSADERKDVLDHHHPDYGDDAVAEVHLGPNKGDKITADVVKEIEAHTRINPDEFDLSSPYLSTDVLVIGGGAAGASAALLAEQEGVDVILATKLRLGDSNSVMAQGGIQAATNANDSPAIHYLDVVGGGHFDNKPELAKALVNDGPIVIDWLENLGVMFDKKADGSYVTRHGGGTSRMRMHSARDFTGSAIMRVLRDEVECRQERIKVMHFVAAVEIVKDSEGRAAGAIMYNLETDEYFFIQAKSVIIATGGFGRLHIKDFPTTNHYGATADGLVVGYRAGANLLFMDSVQYHPTGAVYPEQIVGFLVTEKVRGLGGQPINKDGELFVFPLEPRDVESAAIIRECTSKDMGMKTSTGKVGVWLDSPIIEEIEGAGAIKKNLPAMVMQFERFNIDITKEPMLIYPTLHFQNGGLEIDEKSATKIPGLFAAGEVTGGTHGRNRLMGNSQLEITVFGRRAGTYAAEYAKQVSGFGSLTLDHVRNYERDLDMLGIPKDQVAPMVLPDYIPDTVKAKQLTSHYLGTIRG